MSVKVSFFCDGCDAVAEGADALRREFRSFSGRNHGFGRAVDRLTVDDVVPPGWVAFDPYTFRCYCPACWASIIENSGAARPEAAAEGAG